MGPLALGRRASARPCRSLRLSYGFDMQCSIWGCLGRLVKETVRNCFLVQTMHGVLCTMATPTPVPQVTLTSEVKRGKKGEKKIPDPMIKSCRYSEKKSNKKIGQHHPRQLCFDFCRSFQTFSKAHRNQSVARSLGCAY